MTTSYVVDIMINPDADTFFSLNEASEIQIKQSQLLVEPLHQRQPTQWLSVGLVS